MNYPLKTGDRVKLTPSAVAFYGGAYPHWIPEGQGGGTTGTLLFAGDRPHKPGAAPRPYYVAWDNGTENSYRLEDLEADMDETPKLAPMESSALQECRAFETEDFEPEEEDTDEDTPDEEGPSNVIPFRRM